MVLRLRRQMLTAINLEDIFIGGALGQAGAVFLQQESGEFHASWINEADQSCEDISAAFFDADMDGDLDLYVVSGGNEFEAQSEELYDRLYLNSGLGKFEAASDRLPQMPTSGGVVTAQDFDLDGDIDLFVGGRLVPGSYPHSPRSYLLQNNSGHFFGCYAFVVSRISGSRNDYRCRLDGITTTMAILTWLFPENGQA